MKTTTNPIRRYYCAVQTMTATRAAEASKDARKADRLATRAEKLAEREERRAAILDNACERHAERPAPEQPDDHLTGERIQTPRGSFALTDLSKEQMEAACYGVHHYSNDGQYIIMGNGTRAFAVRNVEAPERSKEAQTTQKAETIRTDAASDHAAVLRTAADVARAEADRLATYAADLAQSEDAYTIGFTLYAGTLSDAYRTAGEIIDEWTARGMVADLDEPRIFAELPTDRADEDGGALLLEVAADIARQSAKATTRREGTPTQWRIRYAAEGRQPDPDLENMQGAAYLALCQCCYTDDKEIERDERRAADIASTRKTMTHYERFYEAITDNDLRSADNILRIAAAARARRADSNSFTWVADAYRAAYLAINNDLTAARSIHVDETPAPLSLDECLDIPAPDEVENKRRADALRRAIIQTAADLTPTRRKTLALIGRGYSYAEAGRKLGTSAKAVFNNVQVIRKVAAAHLADVAPCLASSVVVASVIEEAEKEEARREAARAAAEKARAAANETARRYLMGADSIDVDDLITAAHTAHELSEKASATAADVAAAPITAARAAFVDVARHLSPVRRELLERVARGQSVSVAAREMGRSRPTMFQHVDAIRKALRDAVGQIDNALSQSIEDADAATLAKLLEKFFN